MGMTDPRIEEINSDQWISFPRAEAVLTKLTRLLESPVRTRMPGLLVHGSSGIGKTMIANKVKRDHASNFDMTRGVLSTPVLLLQAPPAPDERRFYMHVLSTIGAPASPGRTLAELEVRTLRYLQGLDLKMIMIDEVHNLLAGTYREQRRFLNVLRFLSNDLKVSLVCFGVSDAVDAMRGDIQLARRMVDHHLPNWKEDEEFANLIITLLDAMPLKEASTLSVKSLRRILAATQGVTSMIFSMIRELAIDAIVTGEEAITDAAVAAWAPEATLAPA